MNKKGLNVFISYSHKDAKMRSNFQTHLDVLSHFYDINYWYDGKIPVGGDIDNEVLTKLKKADIIILLISPNYLSSYYCYEKELKMAMDRHYKNECIVIPVILRDIMREHYPFSRLKYVPTDGRPIDSFNPHNKGYKDAATGIGNLIRQFVEKSKSANVVSTIKPPSNPKKNIKNETNCFSATKCQNNPVKYYLIKNGQPSSFELKQREFECIISFNKKIPEFIEDANLLLKNQLNNFKKQIYSKSTISEVLYRSKTDINSYFSQLFTYIQKHFLDVESTYVHFRCKKGDCYCTLSEFGYPIEELKTEPIPVYNSIIGQSLALKQPIIKSYNNKFHKLTHTDERVNRNYITFTFDRISQYFNVDISMCISAIGRSSMNKCKNIFMVMAINRFDKVVENYIIRYIDGCKKLYPEYNIINVLNYGG